MLNQLQRDKPNVLIEAKAAIRRLMETYKRMETLMAKKFGPHVNEYSSILTHKSDREGVERQIRDLCDGLAALVKTEMRRQEAFVNVREMAKRFEESSSIEEIVSLIGLTLLADYKGHTSGVNLILEICRDKIYPSTPILAQLMQSALELDKVCKWTHEILDYDPKNGEDDIIRMITAIESLDLSRFDRICEGLHQRLGVEEVREGQ